MKLGPKPKLAPGGNLRKIGTRECAEVVKYWRRDLLPKKSVPLKAHFPSGQLPSRGPLIDDHVISLQSTACTLICYNLCVFHLLMQTDGSLVNKKEH